MRWLQRLLWLIAILLFIWVVLQFLAPANAQAKELLDMYNDILEAIRRFGLRFIRLFWI